MRREAENGSTIKHSLTGQSCLNSRTSFTIFPLVNRFVNTVKLKLLQKFRAKNNKQHTVHVIFILSVYMIYITKDDEFGM